MVEAIIGRCMGFVGVASVGRRESCAGVPIWELRDEVPPTPYLQTPLFQRDSDFGKQLQEN